MANRQWLFQQADHSGYLCPGTRRPRAYKDFGCGSQTGLTRGFSFEGGTGYGKQALLIQGQFYPALVCLYYINYRERIMQIRQGDKDTKVLLIRGIMVGPDYVK